MQTLPPTMAILSLGHFFGQLLLKVWPAGLLEPPRNLPRNLFHHLGFFPFRILICQRHILVERATLTGFLVEHGLVFYVFCTKPRGTWVEHTLGRLMLPKNAAETIVFSMFRNKVFHLRFVALL